MLVVIEKRLKVLLRTYHGVRTLEHDEGAGRFRRASAADRGPVRVKTRIRRTVLVRVRADVQLRRVVLSTKEIRTILQAIERLGELVTRGQRWDRRRLECRTDESRRSPPVAAGTTAR